MRCGTRRGRSAAAARCWASRPGCSRRDADAGDGVAEVLGREPTPEDAAAFAEPIDDPVPRRLETRRSRPSPCGGSRASTTEEIGRELNVSTQDRRPEAPADPRHLERGSGHVKTRDPSRSSRLARDDLQCRSTRSATGSRPPGAQGQSPDLVDVPRRGPGGGAGTAVPRPAGPRPASTGGRGERPDAAGLPRAIPRAGRGRRFGVPTR